MTAIATKEWTPWGEASEEKKPSPGPSSSSTGASTEWTPWGSAAEEEKAASSKPSDGLAMTKESFAEEFGSKAVLDKPSDLAKFSKWDDLIKAKAAKYGVEEGDIKALMYQESRGNPNAVSKAGAQGLMQLMPGTAKDMGVVDINDPDQNADGGVKYYKQMLDRYHGNKLLAAAAYNAGPGRADKFGEDWKKYPLETQDYVTKFRQRTQSTWEDFKELGGSALKAAMPGGMLIQPDFENGGFDYEGLKAVGRGLKSQVEPFVNVMDKFQELTGEGMAGAAILSGKALDSDYIQEQGWKMLATTEILKMEKAKMNGDINEALAPSPLQDNAFNKLKNMFMEQAAVLPAYGAQIRGIQIATNLKNIPLIIGTLETGKGLIMGMSPSDAFWHGLESGGLALAGSIGAAMPVGKFAKAGFAGTTMAAATMAMGGTPEDAMFQGMMGATYGYNNFKTAGGQRFSTNLYRELGYGQPIEMQIEKAKEIQLNSEKFTAIYDSTLGEAKATVEKIRPFQKAFKKEVKGLPAQEVKEFGQLVISAKDILSPEIADGIGNYIKMRSENAKVGGKRKPSLTVSEQKIQKAIDTYLANGKKRLLDTLAKEDFPVGEFMSDIGKDWFGKLFSKKNTWNQLEKFSEIQGKIGPETGTLTYDFITSRLKESNDHIRLWKESGWNDLRKQIAKEEKKSPGFDKKMDTWVQYVDTDAQGKPHWTDNALVEKGNVIPAYPKDLPKPVGRELDMVFQYRKTLDWLQTQSVAGYRTRYQPRRNVANPTTKRGTQKSVLENAENQTFTKHRVANEGSPLRETSSTKLMDKYIREVAKQRNFAPLIPRANKAYTQLMEMGREDLAHDFSKLAGEAFGLPDPTQAKNIFFNDMLLREPNSIGQVVEALTMHEPSLGGQLFTMVQNQMYNAWVGMNFKTQLFQMAQPELMGAAEIGPEYTTKGRAKWAQAITEGKGNRDYDLIYNTPAIRERLFGSDRSYWTAEAGVNQKITSKTVKVIDHILSAPAKPFTYVYGKQENINRPVSFLGAYHQFMDEPNKLKLIMESPMTAGERPKVLDLFRKGNMEATAAEYGIIKAARINFHFDSMNKPDFYKKGIGAAIPFTTYTTNDFMRFVSGDGKSINAATVAKRLAYPALMLGLASVATNTDFTKGHPLFGMTGMLTSSPVPAIGNVVESFFRGRNLETKLQNGFNWISWVNANKMINKARGEGGVKEALGLHPFDESMKSYLPKPPPKAKASRSRRKR